MGNDSHTDTVENCGQGLSMSLLMKTGEGDPVLRYVNEHLISLSIPNFNTVQDCSPCKNLQIFFSLLSIS